MSKLKTDNFHLDDVIRHSKYSANFYRPFTDSELSSFDDDIKYRILATAEAAFCSGWDAFKELNDHD